MFSRSCQEELFGLHFGSLLLIFLFLLKSFSNNVFYVFPFFQLLPDPPHFSLTLLFSLLKTNHKTTKMKIKTNKKADKTTLPKRNNPKETWGFILYWSTTPRHGTSPGVWLIKPGILLDKLVFPSVMANTDCQLDGV